MNRLHPLIHVLICLFFSSLIFVFGDLWQLTVIFLLSSCYAILRIKSGLNGLLRSLVNSFPLVVSLALIQLLFNRQGEILWQFHWFRITDLGLYWGIVFALRLSTIILCTKALARLSFPQFQAAFASLHLPEEFSFMLSYGVQLIPMFLAQIRSYVSSLRLRGIEPGKLKWKNKIAVYKLLAVSALAAVISGSTGSAIALELRGFRSKGKRSYLHQSKLKLIDAVALLAMAMLGLLISGALTFF